MDQRSTPVSRDSSLKSPHASKSSRSKVIKRNDSLYELGESPTTPSMVVLFFHGLYSSDVADMHLCPWQSEDGSYMWPNNWLAQEFPRARILYVSYDGSVRGSEGKLGMYLVGENLVSDLMQEDIGQLDNCPIIMVGYCFGGLVIKQLCLHINNMSSFALREKRKLEKLKLEKLLYNIKGIFYYGTPHKGIPWKLGDGWDSPLLQYFKILSADASRLNSDFAKLCKVMDWRTRGLGESRITQKGLFKGFIVAPDASARDGDDFNVLAFDHTSICKPENTNDSRYYALKDFVHNIADNLEIVESGHKCHDLPEYQVDLERRAQEVQDKFGVAGVLGIHGMGGIGKTTLAKKLYNKISEEFDYTCFVDDVKNIPIHELEDRVLKLFYDNKRELSQNQGTWVRVKGRKILIVMDDVDSQDQLKKLPDLQYFGNGSRLIITTRNEAIMNRYGKKGIYQVDFLSRDDAEKLFCQHAFGQEGVPVCSIGRDHLVQNVKAVVAKCDGLPLTLEVMGSYLKDCTNEPDIWQQLIEKLGKAQSITGDKDDKLWASLKVSYDNLGKKEQKMFIDAATFFFEQPFERALAAWNDSKATWINLEKRSLVKKVSKTEYSRAFNLATQYEEVWVHEQLRDLAKKLVKGVTISGVDEMANKSVDKINTNQHLKEDAKGLRLSYREYYHKNRRKLQLHSVAKLKKLKYVDLDGVVHDDLGKDLTSQFALVRWHADSVNSLFPINLNNNEKLAVLELKNWYISENFSQALANLPNLRILSLENVKGQNGKLSLPENFSKLSLLRRLDLTGFHQLILPKTFGNLPALAHLRLDDIDCLSLPMSFGDLSSLVTLQIGRCANMVSLPTSFGHGLKKLEKLWIHDCPLFESLPPSFSELSALQRLDLQGCISLKESGDSFRNLSGLRVLRMIGSTRIERLPASFGLLSSLEQLWLACRASLPDSFGHLRALHHLTIILDKSKELPDSIGRLQSLETLGITGPELQSLPESLGELAGLEHLDVDAAQLKTLPESFGLLSSLKSLTIQCPELQRLPENLGELARLQLLHVYAGQLKTLPESLGLLSSLQDLTIECPELQRLPQRLGELAGLESLEVDAAQLKTVPESLGLLSSLNSLAFECPKLERLPESLGELAELKSLYVTATQLKTLPESLGELAELKSLYVTATQLKTLPESLGLLSSLNSLTINCPKLERLPESLGELVELKSLYVNASELKTVPESLRLLSSLQNLTIDGPELERLPESLGELAELKSLVVNAAQLKKLPESLGLLSSLEELRIIRPDLERLPESLGELAGLKRFYVNAAQLKTLPERLGLLSSLKSLTIECPKLERLPESLVELVGLESFEVNTAQLKTVPESLGLLSSLKSLTIKCPKLETFPESLGELAGLESLYVYAGQLKTLPQSLGLLSSLKSLTIKCPKLERLPEGLGELAGLQSFDLGTAQLKTLPESLGLLSSLQELTINGPQRQRLPQRLGELAGLESLEVDAAQLKTVPESLGLLSPLNSLTMKCPKLERFPESLGEVAELESLEVDAAQLKTVPESLRLHSSLKSLAIKCPKLERLPEGLGELAGLQSFDLGTTQLKTLRESLGLLSCLQELTINGPRAECDALKHSGFT